jgi:transcriptional regulator with XRE-family HTH domain
MDETEVTAILGSNVKKYRKAKKLTQEKLAAALGVSTNYVSDVETGKAWISAKTMGGLAEALEVAPAQLFQQDAFYETHEVPAVVSKYAKEMAVIIAECLQLDLSAKR